MTHFFLKTILDNANLPHKSFSFLNRFDMEVDKFINKIWCKMFDMLRLVSLVKLWIRARVMHRCSHQLIHFIRFLFNSVPCKNPKEKNTLFGEHKSYRYQTIAVTLQKDLAKEKKRSSLENKTIQKIENSDDTLESVILCSREANVVRKSHFSAGNKVSMPL